METYHSFFCDGCQQTKLHKGAYDCGYGMVDGKRYCYACCAARDSATLVADGHNRQGIPLYHSKGQDGLWYVTNWPGTLRFPIFSQVRKRGPFGRPTVYFSFTGPDSKRWSGFQCGDNNDLAHVRRLKGGN